MTSPVTSPVSHWDVIAKDGVLALKRTFGFADWAQALAFVNRVGALADAQDHHPLVELTWGRVTLFSWSHDVKGLSPRDERFCLAVNALVGP